MIEYDPKLDLASYKMPSIELLEEYGSSEIKVDKELIVIKKLSNSFGKNNFTIEVFVYDTVKGKNKIEPKKKEKKK